MRHPYGVRSLLSLVLGRLLCFWVPYENRMDGACGGGAQELSEVYGRHIPRLEIHLDTDF